MWSDLCCHSHCPRPTTMEPFLNLGTRGCNPHPAPCKPCSPEHWRTRKWRRRKHAGDISELLLSAKHGARCRQGWELYSTCLGPASSNLYTAVSRAPTPLMSLKSAAPTALGIAMMIWSIRFFLMVNTTVFIYLFNVTVSGWSHVNSLGFTWRHSWEQAYSPLSFLSHPQRQEIILAKNGQWEKECFTTLYMRNKGIKILTRFFFSPSPSLASSLLQPSPWLLLKSP